MSDLIPRREHQPEATISLANLERMKVRLDVLQKPAPILLSVESLNWIKTSDSPQAKTARRYFNLEEPS